MDSFGGQVPRRIAVFRVLQFAAYLDRFVEFPGFPGLPERATVPGEIAAFFSRMQGMSFDLVPAAPRNAIWRGSASTASPGSITIRDRQVDAPYYLKL